MTIRIRWVAVPAALLLAVGCTQESPKPNGTTAPTATTTAPATSATTTASARASAEAPHPQMKPGMHHFGPVGMFLAAAREQQLKDDQKTALDKIEADDAPDPAMGKDWKDFHDALTAQVKAGKVDPSKLSPQLDAIEKAMDARRDKDADALNKIHATLDPAQRKAVVADIRAKQAAREADHAKTEAKEKEKDADRIQHKLDRMKTELGLDDAQQKSIQAILEKNDKGPATWDAMHDEMKKKMDAMLTAFEGDSFDAKKSDWQPMAAKKVREHMEKRAQVLAQIVPVLKPEQRDKLAAQMEKPPMMAPMGRGMGGPGMHGPMGGPGMRGPMGMHPMMGSPFPFDDPAPAPQP